MDCIFCKILKGEIPANKIFEDENFIVILDAFPANEGHSLIIPKLHIENILEIEESKLKEAFALAQKVAKKLKSALNIKDINILQNNGENAGQTVNHFHIHVIPRLPNDKVTLKSEVINLSPERKLELQNLISL